MTRFAELRKQEAADEKSLRDLVGDREPDYEAGEHDAAGLIDPRKVLTSALKKSQRSNGDTPGATEAKALTNGANRHPKTEGQDATAAGGSTDPFVLRLFEGAGPQEIQLLAGMYEARGLTAVARELRERFVDFEKQKGAE